MEWAIKAGMSNKHKTLGKESAFEFIQVLKEKNPSIYFSLMLREIAVDLDSNYVDNIMDSKELWAFNNSQNRACKIPKAIANPKAFALFRREAHVYAATKLLKDVKSSIFKRK